MIRTGCCAELADALCNLLERTRTLQEHVVRTVTALACAHTSLQSGAEGKAATPLWSDPAGHSASPQRAQPNMAPPLHINGAYVDAGVSAPPESVLGPIEMVLTLDIFEVAQTSPGTCCALFRTPCGSVDAAATAAVQEWLRLYASKQQRSAQCGEDIFACHRNENRAVERAPSVAASTSQLAWPVAWWSALAAKQVACCVRVLLLRVPSAYAVLASEGSLTSDCLLKASSASKHFNLGPPPLRNGMDGRRSGVLVTSVQSAGREEPPSLNCSRRLSDSSAISGVVSVASTLTARPSYPSDRFLEVAPQVHVVGVVYETYFENRRALSPAPWVVLLLLLPYSAMPLRREVNLSALDSRTVRAVAVIGEVVEITGHARVTQRQGSSRGGVSKGCGETLLQECVLASWATPLLRSSSSSPVTPSFSPEFAVYVAEAVGSPLMPPALSPASPIMVTVAPSDAAFEPARQVSLLEVGGTPTALRYADFSLTDAQLGVEDASVAELSGWEEERAARIALTCWEGARLALGVELINMEDTCAASAFFSTTLDVVISAQLAIFSAQMGEGVALLLVDEAPESLVTQMLKAFHRAAPSATLELPSSALCGASPSFFLPSYRMQSVPAPVQLSQRLQATTQTASVSASVSNDAMQPPAVRRSFQRAGAHGPSAAAVAAPPPPLYAEVLKGGALTYASGRALVLQGIETIPAATLKVLQEALRTASDDEKDSDGTVVGAAAATDVNDDGGPFCSFVSGAHTTRASESANITDAPVTQASGARHAIQREGGQFVKYRVVHAAVCSVRQGARLAEKSHLFEFAQRCDVVLRPAYDRRRQEAALQATVVAPLQVLLCSRQEAWLNLLGKAFAFPTKLRAAANAAAPISELDAPPALTEPCNRLLSTYFIAAKALCHEGTDASMMTTLVKLTVIHAQWRYRLTELCSRKRADRNSGGVLRGCRGAAAKGPLRATALIDAVVAVGLCDATLHFFTARALLGECVLQLLEREAWPIWEAEADAEEPQRGALPDQAMRECWADEEGGVRWHLPPGATQAVSTEAQQLYQQIEFRTRCGFDSISHCCESLRPSVFSIQQLVQDLIDHLERSTHGIAPTAAQQ